LKHRETKESVKHNTSLQKRVNYLIRLNQKWRFISRFSVGTTVIISLNCPEASRDVAVQTLAVTGNTLSLADVLFYTLSVTYTRYMTVTTYVIPPFGLCRLHAHNAPPSLFLCESSLSMYPELGIIQPVALQNERQLHYLLTFSTCFSV
jgi:hypothetical protein